MKNRVNGERREKTEERVFSREHSTRERIRFDKERVESATQLAVNVGCERE